MLRPRVTFSRNGTTSSGPSGPPKETTSTASYGAAESATSHGYSNTSQIRTRRVKVNTGRRCDTRAEHNLRGVELSGRGPRGRRGTAGAKLDVRRAPLSGKDFLRIGENRPIRTRCCGIALLR